MFAAYVQSLLIGTFFRKTDTKRFLQGPCRKEGAAGSVSLGAGPFRTRPDRSGAVVDHGHRLPGSNGLALGDQHGDGAFCCGDQRDFCLH